MNPLMHEPDGGGLRKGPPRTPTKTAIGAPDPEPNDFERLLRELKPKLDKLPDGLRIPAVPPNADAASEVEEYVKEELGITPAGEVPTWVFIGGECVERPKIHEGRIGLLDGVPVFAFLYPYEAKKLRAVIIHPRDGIDPRMIAKAILWGILGEIPADVANSQILGVDEFFGLRCLDAGRLVDAPRLAKAKAEIERAAAERCAAVSVKLDQAQSANAALQKSLNEIEEQRSASRSDAVHQHNRAEVWRVVAFFLLALIPLFLAIGRALAR